MSYSYIAYLVKMEYVSKLNIFGLKMMVKSGPKNILKFLHMLVLPKIANSVVKNTFFAHGGILMKKM